MPTTYPVQFTQAMQLSIEGVVTGAGPDTKRVVNLLTWASSSFGPAVPPALAIALANIRAALATAWANAMSSHWITVAVGLRWLNDPTAAVVFDATPATWDGTVTGDFQPTDSSAFIEKVIAWRYRGSRPGLHISPIPEGYTTDFVLNSTGLPALQALANTIQGISFTQPSGDVFDPAVVSTTRLVPDPVTGLCPTWGALTTAHRCRKTLGTMVHRKVKGRY